MWLLAGFSFSLVVGQRLPTRLLAMWTSLQGSSQHDSWLSQSEREAKRRSTRQKLQSFVTRFQKGHVIIFAIFYGLQASYQVRPILTGNGIIQGHEGVGGGDYEQPSLKLPTTLIVHVVNGIVLQIYLMASSVLALMYRKQ